MGEVPLRIMVMGAGSIGSLFGGYLAKAGNEVVLVGREEHVQAIKKSGLEIREGFTHNIKLRAVNSPTRIEGSFDLILLTVKAYDTRQVVMQMRKFKNSETTLLCLQNGLGTEEIAAKYIEMPVRGVTMNASLLLQPGVIIHTGYGDTIIGERDGHTSERLKKIARMFSNADINTRITDNICGAVWTKTLVNSGINPFGAITGMRNGELLQIPYLKRLMVRTVEEGVNVADKIGINLEEDPVSMVIKTAELTANNKNSMLQDILRKKQTEIDFINGAISKQGRKNRVPTPMNDVLTGFIKALELKNKI